MVLNERSDVNDLTKDRVTIEKIKEIKYLGVVLDQKLLFGSHIDYICKKIAKKIVFFLKG